MTISAPTPSVEPTRPTSIASVPGPKGCPIEGGLLEQELELNFPHLQFGGKHG